MVMITVKQIVLFVFIAILLVSCKKENEDPATVTQPGPTYFTFSGELETNDNSTLVSFDNNLVSCGNYKDNICILKISKSGNQLWRKDFYAGSGSIASAIAESDDHDLFVCGRTARNQMTSRGDVLLIKTNSNGDTLWSKIYGGIKDDFGCQIIKSNDGNMVICGFSYSYTTSYICDIYLIKVNADGDTLWTRTYPDPDQETPFHLMQTQNGEYLVTGTNEDNGQHRELYLLKTDANGNKIWDKKIGPPTWKWGFSTIELSNGDLLTCGRHSTSGFSQVLLVKTDLLGNEYWEKEFGAEDLSEEGNSMKQNSDGTFTITGSSYDMNTMKYDIVLLKVDQNGNQTWFKKFGGSDSEWGLNLIKDANDDNIITGTTFSYGTGSSDGNIFMTKTDNDGNFK
jgi:hypothetical protein